jgi:hypothetical protein
LGLRNLIRREAGIIRFVLAFIWVEIDV